jgi:hypothetical protein
MSGGGGSGDHDILSLDPVLFTAGGPNGEKEENDANNKAVRLLGATTSRVGISTTSTGAEPSASASTAVTMGSANVLTGTGALMMTQRYSKRDSGIRVGAAFGSTLKFANGHRLVLLTLLLSRLFGGESYGGTLVALWQCCEAMVQKTSNVKELGLRKATTAK